MQELATKHDWEFLTGSDCWQWRTSNQYTTADAENILDKGEAGFKDQDLEVPEYRLNCIFALPFDSNGAIVSNGPRTSGNQRSFDI